MLYHIRYTRRGQGCRGGFHSRDINAPHREAAEAELRGWEMKKYPHGRITILTIEEEKPRRYLPKKKVRTPPPPPPYLSLGDWVRVCKSDSTINGQICKYIRKLAKPVPYAIIMLNGKDFAIREEWLVKVVPRTVWDEIPRPAALILEDAS